jgi:hypothetical protein
MSDVAVVVVVVAVSLLDAWLEPSSPLEVVVDVVVSADYRLNSPCANTLVFLIETIKQAQAQSRTKSSNK